MMQAAVLRVGDAVALRFDEVINGEIDIEEQKTGSVKPSLSLLQWCR